MEKKTDYCVICEYLGKNNDGSNRISISEGMFQETAAERIAYKMNRKYKTNRFFYGHIIPESGGMF